MVRMLVYVAFAGVNPMENDIPGFAARPCRCRLGDRAPISGRCAATALRPAQCSSRSKIVRVDRHQRRHGRAA